MNCQLHQNSTAPYCTVCDLYERLSAHQATVAALKQDAVRTSERIAELEAENERLKQDAARFCEYSKAKGGWLVTGCGSTEENLMDYCGYCGHRVRYTESESV